MSTPSQPRVRVAILLEAVQLSDIIGIDILGNLSTAFVKQAASVSPAHAVFVPLSIPFEFFYVASTLDPTSTTPQNFRYLPTVTYDTCPRDLDIVIMGGPFLDHRPEAATRFMQEAWGRTRTWMTVCTGSMWLASVGVLDGKRATTNRMMLGVARGMHPGVEWMDERWTVGAKEYDGGRGEGEGELWTAGGAGCGIDMIAAWALRNYDEKFVRVLALDSLEFYPEGDHGQRYKDEVYRYQEFTPRLPDAAEA